MIVVGEMVRESEEQKECPEGVDPSLRVLVDFLRWEDLHSLCPEGQVRSPIRGGHSDQVAGLARWGKSEESARRVSIPPSARWSTSIEFFLVDFPARESKGRPARAPRGKCGVRSVAGAEEHKFGLV